MSNVTIKDVAQLASVSIATVSRVLNKNYYVSPDLESKVTAAIEQLGYYPNSVARSLKNQSTMTIGFLVSDISNNFFTNIFRAIEDSIREYHYNLLVCNTDHDKEREYDYLQLMLEKKVDGIIINTTGFNDDFISSISERIPVALCSRRIMTAEFKGDLVDSDNIRGSYDLTSHLISLGHTKIGIVNGPIHVSSAIERLEGFQKAMGEIGIKVDQNYPYYFNGNFSVDGGFQCAKKLLSRNDPPTAIVFMNNEMAAGALRYCRLNNIDVPDSVSIASYDRIVNDDLLYVHPCFVTMEPLEIGKKLAELIVERIQNKDKASDIPNREIRLLSHLVVGNGTKRITNTINR
jgi:DNA-binding LacI/PurR family transcriptional regulator